MCDGGGAGNCGGVGNGDWGWVTVVGVGSGDWDYTSKNMGHWKHDYSRSLVAPTRGDGGSVAPQVDQKQITTANIH